MPVAVGELVLEIAQAMAVLPRLRGVIMRERLFQPVPVVIAISARRSVGHDDMRVSVRLFTGRPVRVLDDLHQAVDV